MLESALARPYQTFDNIDLYPTAIEKSAALLQSIVTNHPFIDGNKRTAYTLFRLSLLKSGFDINASQEEKYNLVISVAKGNLDFDSIVHWINKKIIKS
ncbi:MAG: hypothetical protein Kapaf2KO_10890 [Candidatus Kapaibacteriales bacterium]